MSRSGYSDDCDDQWAHIRWRGAVVAATKGRRGQAFLVELLAYLDAMPEKILIGQSFQEGGAYCTLGVACAARGVEPPKYEPEDYWDDGAEVIREEAAATLGIAEALAAEIMFWNDEGSFGQETPAQRWGRMRQWVYSQIK